MKTTIVTAGATAATAAIGGVAAQGPVRLAAVVAREHAEPRSGRLPGGAAGDAVAADVQARAQRGELAGDRTVTPQRTPGQPAA
jgi:hypothetical protein